MKRVKLYAYWAQNLGDDLMVEILLKRYPKTVFYCNDYNASLYNYSYQNLITQATLGKKYQKINHIANFLTLGKKAGWFIRLLSKGILATMQGSVYIGGSLFMEDCNHDLSKRIEYENTRLAYSPLHIIGANFGPFTSQDFLHSFSELFRHCASVTFRDNLSVSLFSDLNNVFYAPDVVFNLDTCKYPAERILSNRVIISVIDATVRENTKAFFHQYETLIENLCKKLVALGKTPVLMSFCKAEGDEVAINRILGKLPPEIQSKVVTHFYQGDIDAALQEFSCSERIIATRFHSMILAMCFNKPFYALAYSPKISNVLDEMKVTRYCPFCQLGSLSLYDLFTETAEIIDISELKRCAENQFSQFDAFIAR